MTRSVSREISRDSNRSRTNLSQTLCNPHPIAVRGYHIVSKYIPSTGTYRSLYQKSYVFPELLAHQSSMYHDDALALGCDPRSLMADWLPCALCVGPSQKQSAEHRSIFTSTRQGRIPQTYSHGRRSRPTLFSRFERNDQKEIRITS